MSLDKDARTIPQESEEIICIDSDDDDDDEDEEVDSEFLDTLTCDDRVREDIENILDHEIGAELNLDSVNRNPVYNHSDDSNDVIVLSDESFDDDDDSDDVNNEELFLGRIMRIFDMARNKKCSKASESSSNINRISYDNSDVNSDDNTDNSDANSDDNKDNSDVNSDDNKDNSDDDDVLLVDVNQILSKCDNGNSRKDENEKKSGEEDEIVDIENVDDNEDFVSILKCQTRKEQCRKRSSQRKKRNRPVHHGKYSSKRKGYNLGLHIVRERERRIVLRQRLNNLQQVVPSVQGSTRVSSQMVLREATLYIFELQSKEEVLRKELLYLKKRKLQLEHHLKLKKLRIR